jgi:hypothetical protein
MEINIEHTFKNKYEEIFENITIKNLVQNFLTWANSKWWKHYYISPKAGL